MLLAFFCNRCLQIGQKKELRNADVISNRYSFLKCCFSISAFLYIISNDNQQDD